MRMIKGLRKTHLKFVYKTGKMTYQSIMAIIPTIHAAQLAKMNVDAMKKTSSTKDLIGLGAKNIIGVNLIKIESDLIAGL